MKKIDSFFTRVTSIVSIVSYAGFFAVMLIIVFDVFLRRITGSGISGTYEIVERTLMCGVFASFAYTQSLHGHVRVTMFFSKFPKVLRFITNALAYLFGAVAAAALTYAAIIQTGVSSSTGTKTGVLGMPLAPFFLIEAICMAIFAIVLLWEVVKSFAAIGNDELAEDIMKDWV